MAGRVQRDNHQMLKRSDLFGGLRLSSIHLQNERYKFRSVELS